MYANDFFYYDDNGGDGGGGGVGGCDIGRKIERIFTHKLRMLNKDDGINVWLCSLVQFHLLHIAVVFVAVAVVGILYVFYFQMCVYVWMWRNSIPSCFYV